MCEYGRIPSSTSINEVTPQRPESCVFVAFLIPPTREAPPVFSVTLVVWSSFLLCSDRSLSHLPRDASVPSPTQIPFHIQSCQPRSVEGPVAFSADTGLLLPGTVQDGSWLGGTWPHPLATACNLASR